jgi:hypothetical protein
VRRPTRRLRRCGRHATRVRRLSWTRSPCLAPLPPPRSASPPPCAAVASSTPRGQAYACRLTVDPGVWGARVLDEAGSHDGIVRLSRGVGLPEPLPDVDGLALRLPGMGVGGAPLDLLINSAWRYAFAPSVVSRTWSSVLPYTTGSGATVLLGARPEEAGFRLMAATLLGQWTTWGRLEVLEPVDGEDLHFAPTVGADDLVPSQLFRSLRDWSYAASQAARR